MCSQNLNISYPIGSSVAGQVHIEGAGMWCTASTTALIEEHDPVNIGIKKAAVPGRTARTRAAMQNNGLLAVWVDTGFPVEPIAIANIQPARLIRLDLWIQISHAIPTSHTALRKIPENRGHK